MTYALKARRILARRGIEAKAVKTDGGKENEGCAYGIEVRDADFYATVNILRENEISYSIWEK